MSVSLQYSMLPWSTTGVSLCLFWNTNLLFDCAEVCNPAGLPAVDGLQSSCSRSATESSLSQADAAAAGLSSSGREGVTYPDSLATILPDTAELTLAHCELIATQDGCPLRHSMCMMGLYLHPWVRLSASLYCRLCGLPQAHIVGRSTPAVTSRRGAACSADQQLPPQYAELSGWSSRQGRLHPFRLWRMDASRLALCIEEHFLVVSTSYLAVHRQCEALASPDADSSSWLGLKPPGHTLPAGDGAGSVQ